MKKIIFLILVVFATTIKAQKIADSIQYNCGHLQSISAERMINPGFEVLTLEDDIQTWIAAHPNLTGPYTIPVVFHVLSNGDAYGVESNISLAQIKWQMNALNNAFANNTVNYNFQGWGSHADNSQIKFCLATIPQGTINGTPVSFYTNPSNNEVECGVMRYTNVATATLTHSITDAVTTAANQQTLLDITHNPLGGLNLFPFENYLNIWLVDQICDANGCNTIGYATMPGATTFDGIVMRADVIGDNTVTTNAFPMFAPLDNGKILAHEVGHYLALYHTFYPNEMNPPPAVCYGDNDANCSTDGDFVCDTPPTTYTGNAGCNPFPADNCVESITYPGTMAPSNRNDMVENYMSYSDDNCMNTFTFGQIQRMQAVLNIATARQNLASAANLAATGLSNAAVCVCAFKDANFSWRNLSTPCNSIEFKAPLASSLSAGVTYFWNFGDGFNSTSLNPIHTYVTPGIYTTTLTITYPDGTQATQSVVIDKSAIEVQMTSFAAGDACNGSLQQIYLTFRGATAPLVYTITNGLTAQTYTVNTVLPDGDLVHQFYFYADIAHTIYTVTSVRDNLHCVVNPNVQVNVPVINCCSNLVVNGDFEQGAIGFTSDNAISCAPSGFGTASVFDSDPVAPNTVTCSGAGNPLTTTGGFWNAIFTLDCRASTGTNTLPYTMPLNDPNVTSVLWQQDNINVDAGSNYNIDMFVRAPGGGSLSNNYPFRVRLEILDNTNTVVQSFGNVDLIHSDLGFNNYPNYANLAFFQYSYLWNNPGYTGTISLRLLQVQYFNGSQFDPSIDNISIRRNNPPAPPVAINPSSSTICTGQNIVLTAVGSTAGYTWLPATGLNTSVGAVVTATPTVTTTYTVTGVNACAAQATANVIVRPLTTVSVTPTATTTCAGQLVTLTASGATNYLWTPSGNNGNTIQVAPNATTTYSVTDFYGCSATATSTVTINQPIIAVNSPTVCAGNPATLTASGASTYLWNTGATTASITVNAASTTTYTVVGTNASGCSATTTGTVTISTNPPPSVTATSATICIGQSATLTASGASTYLWNTTATTASTTVTPTATTIYTVTGTGANGCTATATSTVTINPLPTVTATSTTTCSGQAVTITASGANTYLWNTGSNTASITVSPTSTTIYTVAGTNTSTGCSASATSTVTTINPPTPVAGFTYPVYDNVVGTAVTFTNTSTNATSYLWDFMDGTTSTSASTTVPHTFTTPGYYKVQLIAYNQCGVYDKTASIIYIIPSAGTYTPTPSCLGSFTYNYTNLNITTPTTWNTGTTINIKGTLTIKAGGSLTVSNGTTVAFGPQGKVIVEAASGSLARGLLTIDNAKFTGINFTGCGTSGVKMMWQGIEVWGTTSTTSQTPQGKINLINGALIEDAHVAVLLGRSQFIQTSATAFSFNAHSASYNGGIITATNAKFNRNGVSIWFWGENANHSSSIIKNCEFSCQTSTGSNAALLDPTQYFNGLDPVKAHNPFYNTGNTPSNYNTISATGIFMGFSKGVKIYDNNFFHIETGVGSTDAAYTVTKIAPTGGNIFDQVGFGVKSYQTVSSPKAFTVSYNKFRLFGMGVDLFGSQNTIISKNIFNEFSNPLFNQYYQYAIGISNSNAYTIVDNQMNCLTEGIRIYNSGNVAGLIGYESSGNIFTRCKTSIVTQSNNSMLNIHCNNFDNPVQTNYSGKNWNISGTLPDQGQPSTLDAKAPAGNTFNLSTQLNARKEIDASTSTYFNYYPHTDLFTQPTKFNTTSSTFNIQPGVLAMGSVSAACAPVSCGAYCRLAMIERRNKIAELQLEFINVQNFLDKGQTADLLLAIQSNMPVNELRDKLIAASPLSDEVLKALINKAIPLPPQVFHEIIKRNSPVDELVNPHLENKLRNMPPNVAELIRKEQVISEPYRTLTTIKREIAAKENERQLLLNQAIDYSLQNDPGPDEIISLLEEETSVEAKRNLVGLYIEKKDYAAAANKLNTLPMQSAEELAYADLHNIYIDLGNNNKSLWEMSDVQKDKVREIAAICPEGLAVVNAKAVMAIVLGEQAPECLVNNARIAANSINENVDFISDGNPLMYNNISYLGNNIPNPFNQTTHIPYQLPQDINEGVLQIKDMQGKLLKSITITKDKASAEISMDELNNGVYTYSLYINNILIETKRMILMK